MKIVLNTEALDTGYRTQGTGNYINHLKDGLQKTKDNNIYTFYDGKSKLPSIDIYHIPHFSPYIRTLPFNKPAKKVIITLHDLIPVIFHEFFPPGLKGSINWYLHKYILKNRVDHIITNSKSTMEDAISYLNIPEEKFTITYLAADKIYRILNENQRALHKYLRNKYNIPEKFVLYVGDILWSKNIPSLIEAVQEINATLVVVGKQAADKNIDPTHTWNKDLVKMQRIAETDERIITLGFVPDEDLVKLYNMAAVYAQPSHYEGFGVPVIEAMACGCPVVISEKGALPEVVEDAGLYVNPADPRSIADGIGEVYFNPNKYKQLSQKSLNQAKKFNWKSTVEQTIKVYNGL